eukprot:TRINITY_DN537_c0_g1_i1.p1 TRINITY_DN537_c0_g1~~TRINITY_DN537_c0_g1_i1.p1  ORF type:complete len:350 (+),score=72.17 TRINITY_DN537_c0_g1_i1:1414-2463(+)
MSSLPPTPPQVDPGPPSEAGEPTAEEAPFRTPIEAVLSVEDPPVGGSPLESDVTAAADPATPAPEPAAAVREPKPPAVVIPQGSFQLQPLSNYVPAAPAKGAKVPLSPTVPTDVDEIAAAPAAAHVHHTHQHVPAARPVRGRGPGFAGAHDDGGDRVSYDRYSYDRYGPPPRDYWREERERERDRHRRRGSSESRERPVRMKELIDAHYKARAEQEKAAPPKRATDEELWESLEKRLADNQLSFADLAAEPELPEALGFTKLEALRLGKLLRTRARVPTKLATEDIPADPEALEERLGAMELQGIYALVARDYGILLQGEAQTVSDVLRTMQARTRLLAYHRAAGLYES